MNQGAVQSSHVVPSGSPNWWFIENMRAPPHHNHRSFLPPPPSTYIHNHWIDHNQEFPESWSQLLLGSGLVDEEESKTAGSRLERAKKQQNWDEQLMFQISNDCESNLKQENSESYGDEEAKTFSSWANQMSYASSPKSCVTSLSYNMLDFTHKSAEGKINQLSYSDLSSECNSTVTGVAAKKARIQPFSAQSTFKVRKESLRDKITAIHQLVSPFGKTDTATVLLEAIGYIRFLQNQIEALSLPYLGSGSRNMNLQQQPESDEETKRDLRSRGLCLVPVSCTLHFDRDNAADYWAPAYFQ